MGEAVTWPRVVRLHELARGPVTLDLAPDAEQRAAIARRLELRSLPALTARVTVRPWMDGAEIGGRFDAVVEQVCGVSLDPFEQPVVGDFVVQAVPAGSPHAAAGEGGELELDPDAPDAPDVLDGDAIDVAAYVVEHLGLELDPFPRKPGAVFDYAAPETEASPFAALKKLTEPKA
ncbi:DUF177 domain-containing protein [Phenylobacterium sp. SCN 70-31]|uniref:YceD family protein n=1 Tax=Phenylobacterium sp. SCN 70-31 TaxID=1660129 RepID=UPI00086F59A0|nr:DUF177 domain-containing protein [Phenylobacterium sp. SCN 70-31]ODT87466.1 MAG: DNA-binding protein [Phenylobacterium sp. SCN 70-31]